MAKPTRRTRPPVKPEGDESTSPTNIKTGLEGPPKEQTVTSDLKKPLSGFGALIIIVFVGVLVAVVLSRGHSPKTHTKNEVQWVAHCELPGGRPDTTFVVTVEGKTPFFTKTPIRVSTGDVFTLSGEGVIERGYGSEAQRFVGPWGGTILVREVKSTQRALFSPEAWEVPIFGMTVMVGDENGPRRESTLAAYRDGGTAKTVNAFRVLRGERQVIYLGRAEPHRTDFRRENRLHYNDHAGRWIVHLRLFRQTGANG